MADGRGLLLYFVADLLRNTNDLQAAFQKDPLATMQGAPYFLDADQVAVMQTRDVDKMVEVFGREIAEVPQRTIW